MKIGVILGSTRKGRVGERVAKWVMIQLAKVDGVEPVLLDLADFPLPFYAEEAAPSNRQGPYTDEVANRWAAAVNEVDGFVFLVAEYNHGITAVLKNALDYLFKEWLTKPGFILSYSPGLVGGARAVENLRLVAANLKIAILPEALHLGKVQEILTEDGVVVEGSPFDGLLAPHLVSLKEWASMLAEKRKATV